MKVNGTSAVPGQIAPAYDMEAIKARALARTQEEMAKPPLVYDIKNDGRDWARQILARAAAGEDVGLAPEQWAKEALGLIASRQREPGEEE